MRVGLIIAAASFATVGLSACLAKTAVDVATLPVKAAGAAVDATTTSGSEADERRGRAARERERRLDREYRALDKACSRGDPQACAARDDVGAELQALRSD